MTGNNGRAIILQDRDRHLLLELGIMRVIDREQAKKVTGFGSTTRANTRLLALTRSGFLRRFFLGTTGGAMKAIYALSLKSAELVGVPYRGPRRGQDQVLAADFFVAHQLAVNELYCAVKYCPTRGDAFQFVRWISFEEPLSPTIRLIPDGYAEVAAPQKSIAMFVEVDLGNESRSVWRKKVEEYLRYAVSGDFVNRFGQTQFRVLVVANSDRRLSSLRATTAALTEKIFWFTTQEAVCRNGIWSPIWRRATGNAYQPLI